MRYILFFVFTFFCVCVLGKGYSPENLPLRTNGELTYVCNPDKILTQETVDSLNNILLSLERDKGVKSLIITIKDIENDDPYDLAIKVGNKYGVGSKQNTGLILVLATEDRCFYILTGEGLEKYLSDAMCKRVENRVMVPLLKEGRWNEAIIATMTTLKSILVDEHELNREQNNEEVNPFIGLILIFVILFPIILVFILIVKQCKCGHCGKFKLKEINKRTYTDSTGVRHIQIIYECGYCKKQTIKEKTDSSDQDHRLGGGGTFIGGFPMGRGHSGGNSFGGGFGSFGGGSFGGGGAGGRF